MENKRAHQEDFAFFGEAARFSVAGDLPGDRGGLKDAGAVGSRGDSERAVRGIAIVEMKTDGEKLVDQGFGRPRVVDSLLEGGEVEVISGDLLGEGEHQVLMPGDFPVSGGGLIEGDGLDGDGVCGEVAGGDEFAFEGEGRFPDA